MITKITTAALAGAVLLAGCSDSQEPDYQAFADAVEVHVGSRPSDAETRSLARVTCNVITEIDIATATIVVMEGTGIPYMSAADIVDVLDKKVCPYLTPATR